MDVLINEKEMIIYKNNITSVSKHILYYSISL